MSVLIVSSWGLTKMSMVIVTLKIMPESPDVNLEGMQGVVKEKIIAFAGETTMEIEEEPIAFGLKALNITFAYDEDKGSPDDVEASLKEIEGVQSCECTGVRRALG
ncbi:MAG: elongation factor 1-beta [Nanoarchaeota archaeon]|nr:elongation factor 1-beta [Nanoarchaeota archaeon]